MTTFADLEVWCSTARMARFLDATEGNEELAVELYEWNARVSAAFMEVTHHVEVVLRNRLHETLAAAYPPEPPWYRNAAVLTPRGTEAAEKAIRRLQASGREVTEGRTIAALSFGFWDSLFGRRYEDLWRSCLHRAFIPHGPAKRHTVADLTSKIRNFRNLLAHHERVFHLDLYAQHNRFLTLAAWVDPYARSWIEAQSQVPALIARRP